MRDLAIQDKVATRTETLGQYGEDGFPELTTRAKAIAIAVLVLIALLSFFPIGDAASSTETHTATIEVIDAKKDNVMKLVAASAAASTAVSLLPGDAGSPVAQKLMDLSSDFLIVITALFLEKYLLTLMGFAAFKVLIPISCLLLIVAIALGRGAPGRPELSRLAAKIALFGLALFIAVPASVFVSDMVDKTYESSIDKLVVSTEATNEEIEQATGEEGVGGFLSGVVDQVQSIPDRAAKLISDTEQKLNGFIEALAVMIVTSCVVPILVLLFFLWLAKTILGLNVALPARMLRPRSLASISKRK